MRRILPVLVLAALVAPPAFARTPIRPLPTDPPTPRPGAAAAGKLAAALLGRVGVGSPVSHKGMKVFPLTGADSWRRDVYTLDEALKSKALVVTELDGGARVNELKLENVGAKPVFIMGGEIMRGAKQDRTLQGDVIIPPKSGPMTVRAFCTEHGRWEVQSSKFEAADAAVPNSVRGVAKREKSQSRVWSSIEDNQSKLKVAAPTSAAREVYADKQVQTDTRPYVEAFDDVAKAGVLGVAVTYGDKLIAVDVFGDDAVFARLYPKLLRAYVVDVVRDAWRGDRDAQGVRNMLGVGRSAKWTGLQTDGVGDAVEFEAGKLHGSGLVDGGAVIHADMFEGAPEPAADDRPVRPAPNSGTIRR